MSTELGYAALGHRVWVGRLTRDMCSGEVLGPLLERPPGTPAGDAPDANPPLPLRDLAINPARHCAVATYRTRVAALAAVGALDRKRVRVASLPPGDANGGLRELEAGWALKHATLRLSDLTSEVTEEHLVRALAAHGALAPRPDAVEVLRDEDGGHAGAALVRFARRTTARRVAAMCAENMLMVASGALPVRVEFAPGALDDADVPDMADGRAPYEAGRDLVDAAARAFIKANLELAKTLDAAERRVEAEDAEGLPADEGGYVGIAAEILADAARKKADGGTGGGDSTDGGDSAARYKARVVAEPAAGAARGAGAGAGSSSGSSAAAGSFITKKRKSESGAAAAATSSSSSSSAAAADAAGGGGSSITSGRAPAQPPVDSGYRIATHRSLAAHFAQPNTFEFEFALEWRELQHREAAEEARLRSLQQARRARLLLAQKLRFSRIELTKQHKITEYKKFLVALADGQFLQDAQEFARAALEENSITEADWREGLRLASDAAKRNEPLAPAVDARFKLSLLQQQQHPAGPGAMQFGGGGGFGAFAPPASASGLLLMQQPLPPPMGMLAPVPPSITASSSMTASSVGLPAPSPYVGFYDGGSGSGGTQFPSSSPPLGAVHGSLLLPPAGMPPPLGGSGAGGGGGYGMPPPPPIGYQQQQQQPYPPHQHHPPQFGGGPLGGYGGGGSSSSAAAYPPPSHMPPPPAPASAPAPGGFHNQQPPLGGAGGGGISAPPKRVGGGWGSAGVKKK